jgi:cytochrome c oxidase subunit 2
MGLVLVADPPAAFDAWLDGQRLPAAAPATAAERRGKQVFEHSSCVLCHSVRGTIAGARAAPDLTHLASRTTIGAATLPNSNGHLASWVRDSQNVKPGNAMPPNPLRPDDLQALVAYLGSLR